MKKFIAKLKFVVNYLTSFFPTPLPVGIAEFDTWALSILNLTSFPDNDSTRFSLAVMVLHMDSTTASKPRQYFARALHKAGANQIASQVVQDLKQKQKDAENAAKLSEKPAADAPQE
jgi:hypothetical protein